MRNRIKARLEQIEHERALALIADAKYHDRMFRQLQDELGLPLPENVPPEVKDEGLRKIIALQAAIKANRQDHKAAESFRNWVQSIHQRYRDKS